MSAFADVYRGRRVLVTGHTGFKGSWLALWLRELGADVTGFALPPRDAPNHWDLLRLEIDDRRGDIRDAERVAQLIRSAAPSVVFHLAAQSLVRASYLDPLETWGTNVMGTANLLDACRRMNGIEAIVVVTTDKVYQNRGTSAGYRESDNLGGHDPYSASKAASELVVESFRRSFHSDVAHAALASARAGNVIGGGDWSEDRLIPDAARAVQANVPLTIRSPDATRPWQHVLDCLSGYLLLGQRLLENGRQAAESWNFGPAPQDNRSVTEVLTMLKQSWPSLEWRKSTETQPHEAQLLCLDTGKARERLGWRPVWGLARGLTQTADWYRAYYEHRGLASRSQLEAFVDDARAAQHEWAAA